MSLLSVMSDSRKKNYVLYYSALLVLTIITIIPISLQLTKFSFPITTVLFSIGFFSLFMVARNERVGIGLLKFLKIYDRTKKYSVPWIRVYADSIPISYEKLDQVDPYHINDYEEPIALLHNFVKDVTIRHKENMDWTTLDSFRKLNARVEKLRIKAYDE